MIQPMLLQKLPFFLLILIFFLIPNFFLMFGHGSFEYPKRLLFYILITVLTSFNLIALIKRKEELRVKFYPLDTGILFFLGANLISTIFSVEKITSFFGVFGQNSGGLIFQLAFTTLYFNCRFLVKNLKYLKTLIFFSILGGCFALSFGLWQDTGVIYRMRSTSGQAVTSALHLMIAFLLAFGFLGSLSKLPKIILTGSISLLLFLGIIFSLTRGVWLATLFAILFFFTLWSFNLKSDLKVLIKNKVLLIFFLLLFISVAVFFKPVIQPRLVASFQELADRSGIRVRLLEWQGVFDAVRARPVFGSGPATLVYTYPLYRKAELNENDLEWTWKLTEARNLYLQYAATLGIIGLLAYVIILATFLKTSLSSLKKIKDQKEEILLLGIVSAWMGIIIHQFFFSFSITSATFFWGLMGILIGYLESKKYLASRLIFKLSIPQIGGLKQSLFILFVSGLGLLIMFAVGINYYANLFYAQGVLANDYNKFLDCTNKAIYFDPFNSFYYQELGRIKIEQASQILKQYKNGFSAPRETLEQLIKEAESSVLKAKALNSTDPEIDELLARVYLVNAIYSHDPQKGIHTPEFWQAISSASGAHQKNPTDPRVLDILAQVDLEMGSNRLIYATDVAKQVIRLRFRYAPGHYHLGEIYKQLGYLDKAIAAYEQVLTFAPNDRFALEEIEKIKKLKTEGKIQPRKTCCFIP